MVQELQIVPEKTKEISITLTTRKLVQGKNCAENTEKHEIIADFKFELLDFLKILHERTKSCAFYWVNRTRMMALSAGLVAVLIKRNTKIL